MALYRITGPDGSVYQIEGPEDATQQQLVSAVLNQQREERRKAVEERYSAAFTPPVIEEEPETSFLGGLGELAKGLPYGAVNLLEQAGIGAAASLPEDTEKAARKKLEEIAGVAKKPFEAAPGYEDTVMRKFGEAAGSFVPVAAMIPFGPVGIAGAVGLGVFAGAGEARVRAEQEGATEGERATATGLGIIPGAMEIFAPFRIFKRLDSEVINSGVDYVKRALAAGGEEAAQEAAAGFAQNLIAKGVYKPEQELIEGLGEQAAYGGAVGGIAQGLLDLALGRRAKGAPAQETPSAEPTPTPTPTPTAPGAPTETAPQGELFPEELAEAEKAMAGMQGPQPQEVVTPEVPTRDTQTRDMIDELETQQIGEMELSQEEALLARQRAQFESDLAETNARLQTTQEKTTEDQRLSILLPIIESNESGVYRKFIRALREAGYTDPMPTDRERNLIQRSYDVRNAIVSEPTPAETTPSTGLTDQRGEPSSVEPTVSTAGLSELEEQIPEKTTQREPQQLGIPGIGKRLAPEAEPEPEVPAAEFPTVLTPEVLDSTGLPKTSGFYKQLLNKDMADPAQQPEIGQVLQRVRENPRIADSTKQAIERIAMNAFGGLATQQEMFGPRGGVIAPATGGTQRGKPSGTKQPPTGTGPATGGPEVQKPGRADTGTGEPSAPGAAGLDGGEEPAGRTEPREEKQPTTVKEPKGEKKTTPPEGAPTKRGAGTDEGVPKGTGKGAGAEPTEPRAKTTAPKEPKEPTPAKTTETVKKETQKEKKETQKEEKKQTSAINKIGDLLNTNLTSEQADAVGNYVLAANGDTDKALTFLAADIYYGSDRYYNRKTGEYRKILFGGDSELVPGTGGKNGKAFFRALTDSGKAEVMDRVARFNALEASGNEFVEKMDAKKAAPKIVSYVDKEDFEPVYLGKKRTVYETKGGKKPKEGAGKFTYGEGETTPQKVPSWTQEEIDAFWAARDKELGIVTKRTRPPEETEDGRYKSAERGYYDDLLNKDSIAHLRYMSEAAVVSSPMHPLAQDAAKAGDLKKALGILGEKLNGTLGKLATRLAEIIGGTKIVVVGDINRPFEVSRRTFLKSAVASIGALKLPTPSKEMQLDTLKSVWNTSLGVYNTWSDTIENSVEKTIEGGYKSPIYKLLYRNSQDISNTREGLYTHAKTKPVQSFLFRMEYDENYANDGYEYQLNELLSKEGPKALLDLQQAMQSQRSSIQNIIQQFSGKKTSDNDRLTNESGKEIPGYYDPKTDTIYLDAKTGMSPHVLLHEVVHAATSHVIDNKSHPVTKQLQKLFDDVKGLLDTAYGATDLDEFVAESMSNVQFQNKLRMLHPNGDKFSAWQRFSNTISNFARRLLGMEPKPIESALDRANTLIGSILSPSPATRDAGVLYSVSTAPGVKNIMTNLGDIQKAIYKKSPRLENFGFELEEFISGTATEASKRLALQFLPADVLVDIGNQIPSLKIAGSEDLIRLFKEQRAKLGIENDRVNATYGYLAKWANDNPSKVETLNRLWPKATLGVEIAEGKRLGVDPDKPRTAYTKFSASFTTPNSAKPKIKEFDTAKERADAIKAHKQRYGENTAEDFSDPNQEQAKLWDEMQPDWRALGADGQNTYRQVRDSYASLYERILDVIGGTVDAYVKDDQTRKEFRNEVLVKLTKMAGKIDPYFPLYRTGDYWLEFSTTPTAKTNPSEYFIKAFETAGARRKFIEELNNNKDVVQNSINELERPDKLNVDRIPPTSFIGQTFRILEANKVPAEVQKEMMRLVIDLMPESSFVKSLQARKGTLGFEEDLLYTFKNKAPQLVQQTVRLEYSAKIRQARNVINETAEKGNRRLIKDEFLSRAEFALSPPRDAIAEQANRLAFLYTIGGNVSSALTQISSMATIIYPHFGGMFGYLKAGNAIKSATTIFVNSGFNRRIDMTAPNGKTISVDAGAAPALDNFYEIDAKGNFKIRDDLKLSPKLRKEIEEILPLVEVLTENGQLHRSMLADTIGLKDAYKDRSPWERVNAIAAFLFHQSDQFNRQITAVAAYKLELDRLAKEEPNLSLPDRRKKAALFSLYETQLTNGGTVLETAPRIAQQGIGRVAMMYKSYGITINYLLLRTARAAVNNLFAGNKKDRDIAFKQLVGVFGSTVLLAGVQGLPLFGVYTLIANLFYDDDEDDAETRTRKAIGEGWYKGAIAEFGGIDISERIGLSNLIFQANRFNKDPSFEEQVAYVFGGPALSVAARFGRGVNDIAEGDLLRGIEGMVPVAVANAIKGTFRYPSEGGIMTRRGDFIYDDISAGELLAQTFGFAPSEYTFRQEQNAARKGIDIATNKLRSKLHKRYYLAMRMGDYAEMKEVQREIYEFNRKHPTYPITPDSISRSVSQHMKTSAEMYNGISISRGMRTELQQHLSEYDQDFWSDEEE